MKNMAFTKDELKNREDEYKDCAPCSDQNKYPYGLCITLDKETMAKLGMKELPDVGQGFTITGKVEVKSVSKSEHADGGGYSDVGLQITHMELGSGEKTPDKKDQADSLYM